MSFLHEYLPYSNLHLNLSKIKLYRLNNFHNVMHSLKLNLVQNQINLNQFSNLLIILKLRWTGLRI